ncbi:MAG: hypothetical protein LIP01_12565 [Tannerellaceae bacterium]|nr:hypothetical protein [Tannerellaceae bacterium]
MLRSDMLYVDEHKICRNYEKDGRPTMEYKRASKGEHIESVFTENKIVFMLEGLLSVVCGNFDDCLKKGHMLVVPGGTPYVVDVLEKASYIICRIKNNLHLCEEFSLEKLFHEDDLPGTELSP